MSARAREGLAPGTGTIIPFLASKRHTLERIKHIADPQAILRLADQILGGSVPSDDDGFWRFRSDHSPNGPKYDIDIKFERDKCATRGDVFSIRMNDREAEAWDSGNGLLLDGVCYPDAYQALDFALRAIWVAKSSGPVEWGTPCWAKFPTTGKEMCFE